MGNCTVPYFGFKAKQTHQRAKALNHCTVPYFGFKAKPEYEQAVDVELYCALFWIQGKTVVVVLLPLRLLYCALFWIQGKTPLMRCR